MSKNTGARYEIKIDGTPRTPDLDQKGCGANGTTRPGKFFYVAEFTL